MNIKKKIIILLIIVSLVAFSGCTGGKSVAVNKATQGMVINSFTFSPSNMVNGEEGSMVLEVQNIGGTTAEEVKAFLYNIDSTAYFAITGGIAGAETTYLFGDMTPPDTVNNIPSFPESIVFTADNTGLVGAPEGIPVSFDPKVRVCYIYETTATAEFTVISADELRQQTQRGVYKESPVITSSSGGPLSIEILTPQPIKANAAKIITIQVKVRNLDKLNGLVFKEPNIALVPPETIDVCMDPSTLKDKINRVDVSISIPELPGAVFTAQTVRLLKGDGAEGTATFRSNAAVDLSGVVQQDFHIVLTARYGYFIEAQTGFVLENDGN